MNYIEMLVYNIVVTLFITDLERSSKRLTSVTGVFSVRLYFKRAMALVVALNSGSSGPGNWRFCSHSTSDLGQCGI